MTILKDLLGLVLFLALAITGAAQMAHPLVFP